MRNGVKKIQFTQGQDAHQALTRKLIVNFVKHGHIETTIKRARVIKSIVDRLVYKAQRGQESDKNVLLKHFADKKIVNTMINTIAPTFQGQVSGYVKMNRIGARQGDDAEVVRLEWVKQIVVEQPVALTEKAPAKASKKVTTKTKAVKQTKEVAQA